jgi:ribosomal protein L33
MKIQIIEVRRKANFGLLHVASLFSVAQVSLIASACEAYLVLQVKNQSSKKERLNQEKYDKDERKHERHTFQSRDPNFYGSYCCEPYPSFD